MSDRKIEKVDNQEEINFKKIHKDLIDPITIKHIEKLCMIGVPMRTIALIIGVSIRTLERRRKECKELDDAILKGRSLGIQKVLDAAFERATVDKSDRMIEYWIDNIARALHMENEQDMKNPERQGKSSVDVVRLEEAVNKDKFLNYKLVPKFQKKEEPE